MMYEYLFERFMAKERTPAEALKMACEVWGFFPSLVRRRYQHVVLGIGGSLRTCL